MKPARQPDYLITGLGTAISPALDARLQRLRLVDKRGLDADQLELTLEDHDGRLAIPRKGVELQLSLGWVGDALVDRGTFVVDEVEHRGTPDTLTVRARSADLREDNPTKRCGSWHDVTVQEVISEVAGRLGLTPRVTEELAAIVLEHIDQTDESDLHFLSRLAQRFDAISTAKAGHLLFMPMGRGVTASGTPIPPLTLRRDVGDQHRYIEADREAWSGVTAYWNDMPGARRQPVTVGTDDNAKRLRPSYESAARALEEAQAEWQRIQRGGAEMTLHLAEGRPDLYPETPVRLRGFKDRIDTRRWIVAEVTHDMSDTAYTTQLQMEIHPGEHQAQD
ncbi:contractile injection system protein, VgrG/Pvc8 family [Halomonas pacifica]|uniref:contractile injection system protein, VgrG/Pvc8 family n=1 Tax=Bisbaumannia pacifica TaxID=77098 RepID=UPI002358167A|nr:contractile injection system protein, VgrG/Pvc8 family [Halomonas pacifica]MDC8802547.1 contractile injection system protein, VgrG/Pvc8 family [Halomonas pacifica]